MTRNNNAQTPDFLDNVEPPRDPSDHYDDVDFEGDRDGSYHDDDDGSFAGDDEEYEYDSEEERKRSTSQYDVSDDRDDAKDQRNNRPSRPRDYWGRERNRCCDCFTHCLGECCRGFCIPPGCERRRFFGCPHGPCYTIMGLLLGMAGVVISCLYIVSCDVERIVVLDQFGNLPPNPTRIGYGFISRQVEWDEQANYMNCLSYPSEEKALVFDAWFYMARFFLFISTILGFIGFCVLFMALCFAFTPHTFQHWLMWTYLFAALTVPLSYLIFGGSWCSNNQCKLGKGGVQCISIFLFWLCAANTVKSFPPALPPDEEEARRRNNNRERKFEDADEDGLFYETQEDMWNDRPAEQAPLQHPRELDPQYIDDYVDYDDSERQHHDADGNPLDNDYYGSGPEHYQAERDGGYHPEPQEYDDDDGYRDGRDSYYKDGGGGYQDGAYHDDGDRDEFTNLAPSEPAAAQDEYYRAPPAHAEYKGPQSRIGADDGPMIT